MKIDFSHTIFVSAVRVLQVTERYSGIIMNNLLECILDEQTAPDVRGELFLKTIAHVRKMESQKSYQGMISDLLPLAEQNMNTFASSGDFLPAEIEEYIYKYKDFMKECEKYQIWLVGMEEDCNLALALFHMDKVHILGRVDSLHPVLPPSDYIFICSESDGFVGEYMTNRVLGSARIVRFDFITQLARCSGESSYVNCAIEEKLPVTLGIVTGMSYTQRGLNFDNIENGLLCLARPSQDIYLDYHEMQWLYHELVEKRGRTLKYCVIEMNYYRLWYDASLSATNGTMLSSFQHLGVSHHSSVLEKCLKGCEYVEDDRICKELMGKDYINNMFRLFVDKEELEESIWNRGEQTYIPDADKYQEDLLSVKKIFDKNYPQTFRENVGILHRYIKFLKHRGIKCLLYLPPFPRIFIDCAPEDMKKATYEVIDELQGIYGVDCLDLTENDLFTGEHFADSHHLNNQGADMATELLNEYMKEIGWGCA